MKQTEYKWEYVLGAANPQTGASISMFALTVTAHRMNAHSRMMAEHVHVVLMLDDAGWHVARDLRIPSNITLLPFPPYSPEFTPMERLWCWRKEHILSNRVYDDYDTLFAASGDGPARYTQEDIA